jgi:putative oxidoreductase
MERFLHRYSEVGYLVLRLGVAFLFFFHAPQKLFGWYGGGPAWPLYSIRGLASIIELICSALIALGLFTSYAAFLGAAEMVGAYLTVHTHIGKQPSWPIENRGELAVLYFFVFVYMITRGSGKYSLDRVFRGKHSDTDVAARRDYQLPNA